MECDTDVSCSATEIVIPKSDHIDNADVENSTYVKSDDPYAYLERDDFTSERFKIEIWGLPKFYGISQLRKLINEKLQLGCNKVKPMKPASYRAYACFRSEEDRVQALKVINGYKWKGNVLKAQNAKPCPDPLVKKRKGQGETEGNGEGASDKKPRCDKLPLEQRIKDSVSPYWNLPYPEQLSRKEKAIKGVLLRWAKEIQKLNPPLKTWLNEQRDKYQGLPCELRPVQPSPLITGYRNKCEFTIGVNEETGERTVGFRIGSYVDGSAGVAPVDNLDIVPAQMKLAAKIFENYVRSSSHGVFCPETHEGVWRQLMARLSTNEAFMLVVGIHPQNLSKDQLDALREDLRSFFVSGDGVPCKVNSLFLEHLPARSSGSSDSPVEHLFGDTCIYETVCDLSFRISPAAFFQVNTHGAEVLYKTIADLSKLSPKTTLLDVCCGTGTIGLCLSKHCGQVIGIELSKQAVEDAKANASRNEISNCEFFAGGAEDLLSAAIQRAVHDHVVAVVDPPRAGLHQKAMTVLRNAKNLNKLVYVSCDPQAALNNLILLTRAKSKSYYREPFVPVCAVPVDLFPQTNHCELVIYMERYNPTKSSDILNSEKTNSSEAGGDEKEKSGVLNSNTSDNTDVITNIV